MPTDVYSKPEVLLGDLRGGLCSSGLCKQLRTVAAQEIEELMRENEELSSAGAGISEAHTRACMERDLWKERHDRERAAHAKNLTEQQNVEAERNRLRASLLRHACICGPTDPDPLAHSECCEYRIACLGERNGG